MDWRFSGFLKYVFENATLGSWKAQGRSRKRNCFADCVRAARKAVAVLGVLENLIESSVSCQFVREPRGSS